MLGISVYFEVLIDEEYFEPLTFKAQAITRATEMQEIFLKALWVDWKHYTNSLLYLETG